MTIRRGETNFKLVLFVDPYNQAQANACASSKQTHEKIIWEY